MDCELKSNDSASSCGPRSSPATAPTASMMELKKRAKKLLSTLYHEITYKVPIIGRRCGIQTGLKTPQRN